MFSADGHQLVIIIFTCVIVIFLIVGSFAIAVCVFVVIRHHCQNSTEQENLLEGYNKITCTDMQYTFIIVTAAI